MDVFSVSQFVEYLNAALASAVFPEGAVIEGEVVEYRVSQQKWIWFKLKDESSVADCFSTVWQLRQPLEDGMKVRVHGIPKVHPKSGRFSVNVDRVELVGEGALRRAYELLKAKLDAEGLFAPGRKRPIPRFPTSIGLIASKESAACGDFLRILGNRWGGATVHLANVSVQGRDAVREIVGAFSYFERHPGLCEVLVLTRGGGSLEDLQAFNAEEVARAVFAARVPVIVGVGHERDESLADHVADVRASTPSNAAELIAPDRREVAAFIEGGVRTMDSAMRAALSERRRAVEGMASRIESLAERSASAFRHRLQDFARHFAVFTERLAASRAGCEAAGARLASAASGWTGMLTRRLDADARLLATLDPRRPLRQGYALVRGKDGRLLRDSAAVDVGETVDIQLSRGGLLADVKERH